MSHSAEITEIFSSPQGEGPYTGQNMTFVRFSGCGLACLYCDTPHALLSSENCNVESPPGSLNFAEIANPIGAALLCDILAPFDDEFLSITGGEPLEQADFLATWLPSQFSSRRILLETNGVNHAELEKVLPFIHIVSMDFKLPSSSGRKARWNEHALFLQKAVSAQKDTYVKIVITNDTKDNDIQKAIDIITRINKFVPVVLQPAAQSLKYHHPTSQQRIESVERLCRAYLPDVRVMRQMHKEWGVM